MILFGISLFIAGKDWVDTNDVLAIERVEILVEMIIKFTDKDEFFSEERKENELPALKAFQSLTQVKLGQKENLDELIGKIEKHIYSTINVTLKKGFNQNLFEKYDAEFLRQPFNRYIRPLSAILRINGLNDLSFYAKTVITRDEFIDAYLIFRNAVEKERLVEDDYESFIVASSLIFMLVKQYKELRDAYIRMIMMLFMKQQVKSSTSTTKKRN